MEVEVRVEDNNPSVGSGSGTGVVSPVAVKPVDIEGRPVAVIILVPGVGVELASSPCERIFPHPSRKVPLPYAQQVGSESQQ